MAATQPKLRGPPLRAYFHPRVVAIVFLGFASGLPLLLIYGTLSLWLLEAGIDKSAITLFGLAALGYSFKFVWAPLVDKLPLPYLSRALGQRRSWLLVAQLAVISAIVAMATSDPATAAGLTRMAIAAVVLGFSAATQDIVIDAYRIEAVDESLQAVMSSGYITGYRLGMLVAGAVALYIAAGLGTELGAYDFSAWRTTYLCMAAAMLVGVVTTLVVREPVVREEPAYLHGAGGYLRFVLLFAAFVATFAVTFLLLDVPASTVSSGAFVRFLFDAVRLLLALGTAVVVAIAAVRLGAVPMAMVRDTYLEPVRDFVRRYRRGAVLILLLILFYRVSDIVLGAVANFFYAEMGFSKEVIATATKVFGIWMTIAGSFLGGFLCVRLGVMRVLMIGAVLTVLTNLAFIALANAPGDEPLLYLVIAADNLTAGLASAAFVAFLSGLTSLSFTATQYAIFSSLMTLIPKLLASYSGTLVEAVGYSYFFLGASLLGVPVFALVALCRGYFGDPAVDQAADAEPR